MQRAGKTCAESFKHAIGSTNVMYDDLLAGAYNAVSPVAQGQKFVYLMIERSCVEKLV